MFKKMISFAAVVGLIFALATPVQAELVNFQFHAANDNANDTGTIGVLGGGFWNQGDPFMGSGSPITQTWSNLKASDGATDTGVGFTYLTSAGAQNGGSMSYATDNGGLWNGYIYMGDSTSDTIGFTISGLLPGESYELAFYSNWPWSGRVTSVTIGGDTQLIGDGADDLEDAFIENVNYGRFASVTADVNSKIIGVVSSSNRGPSWNGFQIKLIPEPSTLVLLFTGLVGLGLYGWRRRRNAE